MMSPRPSMARPTASDVGDLGGTGLLVTVAGSTPSAPGRSLMGRQYQRLVSLRRRAIHAGAVGRCSSANGPDVPLRAVGPGVIEYSLASNGTLIDVGVRVCHPQRQGGDRGRDEVA